MEDQVFLKMFPEITYEEVAEALKEAFANRVSLVLDFDGIEAGVAMVTMVDTLKKIGKHWPYEYGDIWNVIKFSEISPAATVLVAKKRIDSMINSEAVPKSERAEYDRKFDEIFEIS